MTGVVNLQPSSGYTNRADSPAPPAAPPALPLVPPAASAALAECWAPRRRSLPATPGRRRRLPPRAGWPADGKMGKNMQTHGKTMKNCRKIEKHHPPPPKKTWRLYVGEQQTKQIGHISPTMKWEPEQTPGRVHRQSCERMFFGERSLHCPSFSLMTLHALNLIAAEPWFWSKAASLAFYWSLIKYDSSVLSMRKV